MQALDVMFIDFDWAGVEGKAHYPPFLNPAVPWPDGVHAGILMQQAHDMQLLKASLCGVVGSRVWPWELNASIGLGSALASE